MSWMPIARPGYFGRRRDEKVKNLNETYGAGEWKLAWLLNGQYLDFVPACRYVYEYSYYLHFLKNPTVLDWVCTFDEVIDNAPTNVYSGCDYSIQEAFSTHIQDIAVRNCLKMFGRGFQLPHQMSHLLTIRGEDSNGSILNPGKIPMYHQSMIQAPSLAPKWANPGSVEDYWQSNKWIMIRE